jgi:hypothetical protein
MYYRLHLYWIKTHLSVWLIDSSLYHPVVWSNLLPPSCCFLVWSNLLPPSCAFLCDPIYCGLLVLSCAIQSTAAFLHFLVWSNLLPPSCTFLGDPIYCGLLALSCAIQSTAAFLRFLVWSNLLLPSCAFLCDPIYCGLLAFLCDPIYCRLLALSCVIQSPAAFLRIWSKPLPPSCTCAIYSDLPASSCVPKFGIHDDKDMLWLWSDMPKFSIHAKDILQQCCDVHQNSASMRTACCDYCFNVPQILHRWEGHVATMIWCVSKFSIHDDDIFSNYVPI